jgi:hypothetical protein
MEATCSFETLATTTQHRNTEDRNSICLVRLRNSTIVRTFEALNHCWPGGGWSFHLYCSCSIRLLQIVRVTPQKHYSNFCDEVRLCLCGTAAANGPIVHPQGDTRVNIEQQWNHIDRGNRRTRRKTCPSATLCTTNPTRTDLGENPHLRGEKPATNHLSYGTNSKTLRIGEWSTAH